MTDTKGILACF